MNERLQRLLKRREEEAQKRQELLDKRTAIVDFAKDEAREDLSDAEDTEFRELTAQIKAKDTELRGYDERIAELTEELEAEKRTREGDIAMRRSRRQVEVLDERSATYQRGNGRSYLQDLIRYSLRMDADGAEERLRRHAEEVRTGSEYRDLDRVDGNGGYFVPPAWLMSEYVELARAGRAYANLATGQALPPGTDSINIPKVLTGTSTDIQNGDNTAVSETDLSDTFVSAPVRTIAGQQNVAVQLLDQSPVNFDQVIFRDLVADYATRVNRQVIAGTGINGQVLGVRGTSGIGTVAMASATVAALYSAVADAVQQVHTSRFQAPTVIVMHPRRWGWLLAQLDQNDRPLVLPAGNSPQNGLGTLDAVASQQVVGQLHGLPVVTDPGMPTTVGGNQDVIHVMRASDMLLYESGVKTRVFPDVGSNTLTVRLQVYGYLAFTAGRYPQSIVEIGGAGLVDPFPASS